MSLRSTVRRPVARPLAVPPAIESVTRALQLPLLSVTRKKPKGEIEMPWIWRALRERVYSRMPSYRDGNEIKVTLAPVVVSSPSDTVPGLGIAGDF